jgi:putative FmdB family regulatory protein
MPIYAYQCGSCGHQQDVLQKLSDPVLTVCPACGASTFAKQITAAGFQLKGSGWYQTDFRNSGKPASAPASAPKEGEGAPAAAAAPAACPACPGPAGGCDTPSPQAS